MQAFRLTVLSYIGTACQNMKTELSVSGLMMAETTLTQRKAMIKQKRNIIPDGYIPLDNSIVDMDTVIDFSATEYGLQLYFEDGSGYFWER